MKLKDAGVIWTTPNKCRPLEEVKITFAWKGLRGQDVSFEIMDGDHRLYFKKSVKSEKGKAEITVKPGGIPGVHFITAVTTLPDRTRYERFGSFRVEAATEMVSGKKEIDELFRYLSEGIRQAIDIVRVNGRKITFHKCADNSWENLAYPALGIVAMRYFIRDVKTMFEAIYGLQWPNGRLPDHVYGDGQSFRRYRCEMSDIETSTVSTVYKGWQAHGDDEWVRRLLPKMEKGVRYATGDPLMFDRKYGLIKRTHTCDEWDVTIKVETEPVEPSPGADREIEERKPPFVLMQGDTSVTYEACGLFAKLYTALGDNTRAKYWLKQQEHYYRTGNKLFWDGVKYQHHIHLDFVDHKDFNEKEQLAMSNPWAITRGFADHEKAVSIVNEYMRRLKTTGDRFPWWSLQPGYPDKLHYFPTSGNWSKKQGEYCNGGLFPLVGGELCRAALQHGMENLGVRLLMDFHTAVKRDNGAVFTWYDLQGNASINAPHHQTNYDQWGISPWMQALVEDLAGIRSDGKLFEDVICSPRWSAAGVKNASATAHFPASDTYFAYTYRQDSTRIEMVFTGTGRKASFRIMLPEKTRCSAVAVEDKNMKFREEKIEDSRYIIFSTTINGVRKATVKLKKEAGR